MATEIDYPTISEIEQTRHEIAPYIVQTPVWPWHEMLLTEHVGTDTSVNVKLELFQYTGTFKPRGALANALRLSRDQLARGLTAVSAGNHAIAVSYAAALLQSSAKVVMPKSANPVRVQKCRRYGADVVLVDDVSQAFDKVNEIERAEGRYFVHPFDGKATVSGTATVGFEWHMQAPQLDAVIVPIGGGGLCAGIATAIKQLNSRCQVYGVEPEGADTMFRSLAAGSPQTISHVRTIADSLGAPYATEYCMRLCERFVDEVVLISDNEMRRAMGLLFHSLKLAVEPAGAAATAALCGPLRSRLAGRSVGLLICGTNIDVRSFTDQVIEPQDSTNEKSSPVGEL